MDLSTLVFVIAGAIFLSMTILAFLLVMPQVKTRANLKQRVAVVSGQASSIKGGRPGRGEGGSEHEAIGQSFTVPDAPHRIPVGGAPRAAGSEGTIAEAWWPPFARHAPSS